MISVATFSFSASIPSISSPDRLFLLDDERELFLDTPASEKLFEGVQFDLTARLRRSAKIQ